MTSSEEFFRQRFKEMQIAERRNLDSALSQRKPINLGPSTTIGMQNFLGDEIIFRLTAQDIIREYSRAHGLPSPVFIYDDEQSVPTYTGKKDYYRIHNLNSTVALEPRTVMEKAIEPYKEVLDMHEYRSHIPPLEKIVGHPFLSSFSREKVDKYKERIRKSIPNSFSAVVQTGSSPEKRWSPEQLFQIAETTAANPQLPKPIILSDARLSGKSGEVAELELLAREHKIPVYFFENVEELSAYLGLADFIASTDSAPVWVWEAEKSAGSHALVHHTITNQYWKAPSADAVYSPMVMKGREVRGGYVDNGLKGYAQFFGINDAAAITAPMKEDVDGYCAKLLRYGRK